MSSDPRSSAPIRGKVPAILAFPFLSPCLRGEIFLTSLRLRSEMGFPMSAITRDYGDCICFRRRAGESQSLLLQECLLILEQEQCLERLRERGLKLLKQQFPEQGPARQLAHLHLQKLSPEFLLSLPLVCHAS